MILRLGGVILSVVLHVGLIALLLAWSATDWTRPVFVDLGERADSPGSPSADPSPARSTRPAARAAGAVPAPGRAPARPEPVAPAASSAPVPAPASRTVRGSTRSPTRMSKIPFGYGGRCW